MLTGLLRMIRGYQAGDFNTAGPKTNEGERNAFRPASTPPWENGWYDKAVHRPCHPGRLGVWIQPSALVLHCTETGAGNLFDNIIKYWQREKGLGNAAHFMIGRTYEKGLVQFASINQNANHAGGPKCGGFKHFGVPGVVHPNLVTVGVELDAAGKLRWDGKYFRTWDKKHIIPDGDVYRHTDGTFWHKVTDYQMDTLKTLWADLHPVLKPWTASVVPSAVQQPWAVNRWNNLVGHATLNPVHKSDPGPQVMAWATN